MTAFAELYERVESLERKGIIQGLYVSKPAGSRRWCFSSKGRGGLGGLVLSTAEMRAYLAAAESTIDTFWEQKQRTLVES